MQNRRGWERWLVAVVAGVGLVVSTVAASSAQTAFGAPADSAARNRDGRLEVFGVGTDGTVFTVFQHAIGEGWSGFYPFAAPSGAATSRPVATSPTYEGDLQIAWLGDDGTIYEARQRTDGPGWRPLGRIGDGTDIFVSPPVITGNGRIVLGVTIEGALLQSRRPDPGSEFGAWHPATATTVSTDPDGAVGFVSSGLGETSGHMFVTANDGSLVRLTRTADGLTWGDPVTFPGQPVGRPTATSWLVFAPLANGGTYAHTTVIFRDAGGALRAVALADRSGATFEEYLVFVGPTVGNPVLASNADGRREIFVSGPGGTLWHNFQADAKGWFNKPFHDMGMSCPDTPNVQTNVDFRLEVFCVAGDGQLLHDFQLWTNGPWFGATSLGGTLQA